MKYWASGVVPWVQLMCKLVRFQSTFILNIGVIKGDLQPVTAPSDASDVLKGWKFDGCVVQVVDIPKTSTLGWDSDLHSGSLLKELHWSGSRLQSSLF